jgi:hypothetical protein
MQSAPMFHTSPPNWSQKSSVEKTFSAVFENLHISPKYFDIYLTKPTNFIQWFLGNITIPDLKVWEISFFQSLPSLVWFLEISTLKYYWYVFVLDF